jgi:hypothetical protein
MPARTELDRLAAARPPIVDHPEWIVGPAAEDEILRQILATTQGMSGRRTPARRLSRRPLIGLAAAAAVLAVAGGGALVRSATAHSPAPLRPGSGHRLAGPAALPPDKVMAVLAAMAVDAASRRYILYVRTSYAPGTTVGGVALMETWTKGVSVREKLFSAGGATLNDVSAAISHKKRVRRFVDYSSRTWQTDSIALGQFGSGGPPGRRVGQLLAPHSLGQPQAYLRARGPGRSDSPSRTITAATIHGQRMILVRFSYPRPIPGDGGPDFAPLLGSTEMLPAATGRRNSVVAEQIWISETSYLPVRAVLTGEGGRVLGTQTYAWLSPSAANRAVFSPAPVPAGFRLTQELAH